MSTVTHAAAIHINLLPEELRADERRIPHISWNRMVPIMVTAALLGGLGAIAMIEERNIRVTTAEVATLTVEHDRLAPAEARLAALRSEAAALTTKLALVEQLSRGRDFASAQVNALPAVLPERLWLSDITMTDSLKATLQGVALSPLTVADLVARLDSTLCFRHATLVLAEAGKIQDTPVTRFTVRCGLTR